MSYTESLNYRIEPINYKSIDPTLLEAIRNFLYEMFGSDFTALLPYVNGDKVEYTKNRTVDRRLDTRAYYPFNSDILKPDSIKKAVQVLRDPELNDFLAECHLKKQDDASKMAQLIHERIMEMAGIPDPRPEKKTPEQERAFTILVQRTCFAN
jgi:hypothetical protein